MIQLHDDFSRIWRKAWSFRLAAVTGLLTAITAIMGVKITCGSSPMFLFAFMVVSIISSVAAFATGIARLIKQPKSMP